MANKRVFATSGVVKGLVCLAAVLALGGAAWGQAPPPATGAKTAPAVEENPDIITFEPPSPMDIEVLVEYVGHLLKLKFIYDSQDLAQAGFISIKPHQKIHVDELYHVMQETLLTKNLVMIRAGDWVRILPADRALMFARITGPDDLGPVQVGETIVVEKISLKFADPRDVQDALTPFMTETGTATPMIDQKLVIVTEYRSRMEMLRQLVKLVDVPQKKVVTRILKLEYTKAPDIAYKLANYLQVLNQPRQKVIPVRTVTPAGVRMNYTQRPATPELTPFVEVDERTNRLFLYGLSEDLEELQTLVLELDVERVDIQEVMAYPLTYLVASDALISLQDLGYVEAGTTAARPRTTTRPTTGGVRAPTVGQPTGDVGGSGADVRVTVLVETNTLVVRATRDEQERIGLFLKEADSEREKQQRVRVYPLDRRLAAEVAEYLKAIFQSDTIDQRTKAPIPGMEGAPIIVAVVDTNSVVVNATPAQHKQIEGLLKTIDATQPQVLLQCILVEVTNSHDLDLGMELEIFRGVGQNRSMLGSTSFQMSARDAVTGLRTVAAADPGGTIAFINDNVVNVLLHALKQDDKGRILSKPRIVVANNKPGTIEANDQEPTVTVETLDNVTTRRFAGYQKAGTKLTITPRISEGDFLNLHIEAQVSTFTGPALDVGVPPPLADRTINTDIVVPDQRTVIIGGLNGRRKLENIDKIPLFGDIPLLGELFRRTVLEDTETTIYLFVKASILREASFQDLEDETRDARGSIPADLKAIDPQMTEEEAIKEVLRLRELQERRAVEKAQLEAERNIQGKTMEGSGDKIRVIPQKMPTEQLLPTGTEVPPVVVPPPEGTTTPAVEPTAPTIVPPATEGATTTQEPKTPAQPKSPLSSQPIIVPPTR